MKKKVARRKGLDHAAGSGSWLWPPFERPRNVQTAERPSAIRWRWWGTAREARE